MSVLNQSCYSIGHTSASKLGHFIREVSSRQHAPNVLRPDTDISQLYMFLPPPTSYLVFSRPKKLKKDAPTLLSIGPVTWLVESQATSVTSSVSVETFSVSTTGLRSGSSSSVGRPLSCTFLLRSRRFWITSRLRTATAGVNPASNKVCCIRFFAACRQSTSDTSSSHAEKAALSACPPSCFFYSLQNLASPSSTLKLFFKLRGARRRRWCSYLKIEMSRQRFEIYFIKKATWWLWDGSR